MICSSMLIVLVVGLPLKAVDGVVEQPVSSHRCVVPPDIYFADSRPIPSGQALSRSQDLLTHHPRRAWVSTARREQPNESFPTGYLNDDLHIKFSLPGVVQQPATVVSEGPRVTAVAPHVVPAPELQVDGGGVMISGEPSGTSAVAGDPSSQTVPEVGSGHPGCTR